MLHVTCTWTCTNIVHMYKSFCMNTHINKVRNKVIIQDTILLYFLMLAISERKNLERRIPKRRIPKRRFPKRRIKETSATTSKKAPISTERKSNRPTCVIRVSSATNVRASTTTNVRAPTTVTIWDTTTAVRAFIPSLHAASVTICTICALLIKR